MNFDLQLKTIPTLANFCLYFVTEIVDITTR